MYGRYFHVILAVLALVAGASAAHAKETNALTDADQRAIDWFRGIGLPSTAGKPYVRIRWVVAGADAEHPEPNELWELDGFVVSEQDGRMTVLDPDLWPRRVEREPIQGWNGGVMALDLKEVARASIGRLRAIREDPGAVESVDDLFRGIRLRFGDEALAVALASHCAENGLETEAHDLLEAAHALPRLSPEHEGVPLEEVAADQLGESVLWRILFDFSEPSLPRSELLRRLRGWRTSFPASPLVERADDALPVLQRMVKEDESHPAITAEALAALPPEERAQELIYRLRDQRGDVFMNRQGRVSIRTGSATTPAGQLIALGNAAVPALVAAVTDASFTRAVLFIRDMTFERQVVARVGDFARVVLEEITGKEAWDVPRDAPSLFQREGVAAEVQALWKKMLEPGAAFVATLRGLAKESDPRRKRELVASLPDRSTGALPGASNAVWGTKTFLEALPNVDADEARALLQQLVAHAPYPRTKVNAAWALLDMGDRDVVAAISELWNELPHAALGDPEQGGALISFLASCGDPAALEALADGLENRSPAVRELAVLAFKGSGLGAVRGFAADAPDGVPERWPTEAAVLRGIEDLLAARLHDLEQDPLGRIPRQKPMCDLVPDYDSGYRIADAAVRLFARHWPDSYPAPDAPVRTRDEWEALRTTFLATWEAARAGAKEN